MQSFLEETVSEVLTKYAPLEDLIFVLPSKRAGSFVRNAITKAVQQTVFSPTIYSVETFVEKLSGISYASNTEQLFELYETYSNITKGDKDSFHAFSKWGQVVLQDFNEIDRYLIDASKMFSNLSAIQEISIWSPETKKTKMMEDYLSFWSNLEDLYHKFNKTLVDKGLGHQGLVYRLACQNLNTYLDTHSKKIHVFVGFNALNAAENNIIQTILASGSGEIYWDIDSYFLDDQVHDAGYFIRHHQHTWEALKNSPLKGLSNHYLDKKNIEVIGVPKRVSQAKYVGQILKRLHLNDPSLLKSTAVVLGDESLLNPILNSIPKELTEVNITMGYPLDKTPLAGLFTQFLNLYVNKDPQGWFYKPILDILSHPSVQLLLSNQRQSLAAQLSDNIKSNNWTYLTSKKLNTAGEGDPNISLLFFEGEQQPEELVDKCLALIHVLKEKIHEGSDPLSIEYLYRFYRLFNQIRTLMVAHHFIQDIKSLASLYKELLSSETLDFQGEPLEGLQIMGLLESRNLDFETVILTSVNEGILPAGKSNNSYIPFDLKKYFGLPTYKEKDAVYTYHFYRLLQRAKNIYLLYNTEPDVLEGGEKSRLLHQLLTDNNRLGDIREEIAAPFINPTIKSFDVLKKDPGLMALIKEHARVGFSPTSLSNYIRNPLEFYKRNLLKIDEVDEVEETVAANTLGTIVHDTLEDLFTPFIGDYLSVEGLQSARVSIKVLVKHHFAKNYLESQIDRGKNLIAYNVVVRYVEHFLDMEIDAVKVHQIKILALEHNMKIALQIPEIDFPVFLKGKLDRIDTKDGLLRIIDYKTGAVTQNQLEIVAWQDITTDHKYSKAFQLLCYAAMYHANASVDMIEAGIISFKKLKSGFLKFSKKDKKGNGAKKIPQITQGTLSEFMPELKKLVREICNPKMDLEEKEV